MKTQNLLFLSLILISAFSCSKAPSEKAQSSVKSYLQKNLKTPTTYTPLVFSSLDTILENEAKSQTRDSVFKIDHIYTVANSDGDKINMEVSFYLTDDFQVSAVGTKNINGEYGTLSGNVYWKYNNYVGEKPDAGSEITLFPLDSIRQGQKFEAIADVQGNYKVEKIPPGKYFLIVRSKNTTDCPDRHLSNLRLYSAYLSQIFNFDLSEYQEQIKEVSRLDSIAVAAINSKSSAENYKQYGGAAEALETYNSYIKQSRSKAEEIIESFPDKFTDEISLFTGYSKSYDFEEIKIEGNETVNQITDFGTTCI